MRGYYELDAQTCAQAVRSTKADAEREIRRLRAQLGIERKMFLWLLLHFGRHTNACRRPLGPDCTCGWENVKRTLAMPGRQHVIDYLKKVWIRNR